MRKISGMKPLFQAVPKYCVVCPQYNNKSKVSLRKKITAVVLNNLSSSRDIQVAHILKFIKNLAPSQHFPQLNVCPVKELVTYGIRQAEQAPLSQVRGLRF